MKMVLCYFWKKKVLLCVFFVCCFCHFQIKQCKDLCRVWIVCQSIIEKKKLIIEKEFRNGVTVLFGKKKYIYIRNSCNIYFFKKLPHANKYIVEFFIHLKSIFNFIDWKTKKKIYLFKQKENFFFCVKTHSRTNQKHKNDNMAVNKQHNSTTTKKNHSKNTIKQSWCRHLSVVSLRHRLSRDDHRAAQDTLLRDLLSFALQSTTIYQRMNELIDRSMRNEQFYFSCSRVNVTHIGFKSAPTSWCKWWKCSTFAKQNNRC